MNNDPTVETTGAGRTWNPVLLLGPDLVFLLAFAALLAVLASSFHARPTFAQGTFLLPLVCIVGLAGISRVAHSLGIVHALHAESLPKPAAILRDWMPFVLVAFVYENLHEFTSVISSGTVDASLRQADRMIFGTDLSLALQRITTVPMSELMTMSYGLYFVFPTIVLLAFYGRGERERFREFTWALSLSFYLGFVGYILMPAVGPRFAMAGEFTVPLTGALTARGAAAWNSVERVQRDCFPSLHTAISTISLVYMIRYYREWRYGRAILMVCAPLITLLWMSTLYLRYHWGVDVLSGFALAYLCCALAPQIARWYYPRKVRALQLRAASVEREDNLPERLV